MPAQPTLATQTTVVVIVLVLIVIAQGFYLWAGSLAFWPGPGSSPSLDQGLLISRTASIVLLVLAVLTAVLARTVALGIAMALWALLLLVNNGLWPVVGLPGLVIIIVIGLISVARLRKQRVRD